MPSPSWRALAVWIVGASSLVACTSPELPAAERTDFYAAAIEGSDAVFALSVTDDEILLYVCGGPSTFERYSRWYAGTPAYGGGTTTLVAADGSVAHVSLADGVAQGEVLELDGTTLTLEAALATAQQPAALYAATSDGCRTGVVVYSNEDGSTEARGTWCSEEGIYAQVTPILPITGLTERMVVEVDPTPLSIEKRMTVQRIASSAP